MIAWVSPLLMVRSTPLRISLRSPSASTVTWRLRISRVLMRSGLLLDGVVDVDVDGVGVDVALGESDLGVGAHVVQGEVLVLAPDDDDGDLTELHAEGVGLGD